MIVSLSGKIGSGKDTVADILVTHYGFERVAFADAVKEAVYTLDPLIMHRSHARVQSLVDAVGWDEAKAFPEVRRLLQRFGTEVGRDLFGTNFWVERAIATIMRSGNDNIAISDCRFMNELSFVHDADGVSVYIVRDLPAHQIGATASHASENSIGSADCMRIIHNDGTIDDLVGKVRGLVESLPQ